VRPSLPEVGHREQTKEQALPRSGNQSLLRAQGEVPSSPLRTARSRRGEEFSFKLLRFVVGGVPVTSVGPHRSLSGVSKGVVLVCRLLFTAMPNS
jgi:hypothetical protein